MDTEALKPILAGIVRHLLTTMGGALVAGGYMQSSDMAGFIGGGMVVAGILWSWWQKSGQAEVSALLKKMTSRDTVKDAVATAKVTEVVAKILIAAFVCSFLLAGGQANAQTSADPLQQIGTKIKRDFQGVATQAKASVSSKAESTAALPCMDISVITKLTPQNLVPTLKGCEIAGVTQIVTDTQRALDSAKAFSGSATGTNTTGGDNDAINCLTPALALFKAAMIIPAVPDTPAVLNPDGTVKTAAIPGTPEIVPGPILLYQKYREFTLAGGLTSCPTWFNGPVNATAAAGVAGVGTALAGAALLAPK